MREDDVLSEVIPPLHALSKWLQRSGVKHVIIGGIAAALQGRPRATRDIDALVLLPEQSWDSFLRDAKASGFSPRRSDALQFAAKSRMLLLRRDADEMHIDLMLAAVALEEEIIERGRLRDVEGEQVRLATPEDLIIMKSLAMRPNDITDINSLIDAHSDLDARRIRQLVGQIAQDLENPQIAERIELFLRQCGK